MLPVFRFSILHQYSSSILAHCNMVLHAFEFPWGGKVTYFVTSENKKIGLGLM